jgi:hypothetical protein
MNLARSGVHRRCFGFGIATCLIAISAHAACTLPPPPSKVPDAAVATEQEMIAAMETLKRYDTDVRNYTKCLGFELSQHRLSAETKVLKLNEAIDTFKAIAEKFNEQVRLFKAKSA